MSGPTQEERLVMERVLAYDTIVVTRHIRPDGDAIGAAKGLGRILALSFPSKRIVVHSDDSSSHFAFLGPEDPDLDAGAYGTALAIALDTATRERISNSRIQNAKEIVKIDHHIPVEQYGSVNWVEEERSSVCEMVVQFFLHFQDSLRMDKEAATALYTGMVTDSGRFKFPGTNSSTLRLAAFLLDQGVDLQLLNERLYSIPVGYARFKARVYDGLSVTPHGVAHSFISLQARREAGISFEDACLSVSLLEGIEGCPVWIAFIECDDSTIRARLRSRFVPVSGLAERYGGGGHAFAAGATARSVAEMEAMIRDADSLLADSEPNSGEQL